MLPIAIKLPQSRLELHGFQSNPQVPIRVLALHGWLDNCFSFRPLAECLPELNLMAFDLPGHGASSFIPEGMGYDFHNYLVWLNELIEAMDEPPTVLLGHSMGAVIASLYAGVFPEKVPQLMLIEALGPYTVPEQDAPQKMRAYIENWSQQGRIRNSIYANWDEAIRARHKNGPLTLESAAILAERGAEVRGDGVVWRHDPRLKLPSRYQFSEAQTLAFLEKITAPTLFIEAKQSIIPDNGLTQIRRQTVPQIQTLKLDGGHHLHMDNPEPVAHAIRRFLKLEDV